MSLMLSLNRLISLCLLTDIGPLLGGRIHSKLEKEVVPSLDTALRMAGGKTHAVLAFNTTSCSVQTAVSQCSADAAGLKQYLPFLSPHLIWWYLFRNSRINLFSHEPFLLQFKMLFMFCVTQDAQKPQNLQRGQTKLYCLSVSNTK